MRLHIVPHILALPLVAAGYMTPTWPAEPAAPVRSVIDVRPADVGGQRSRPYAMGEPIDIVADAAGDGLMEVSAGKVRFGATGYYRQTILSWASTDIGDGGGRAEESVVWVKAGQVATIKANAIPASPFIIYWTDRTLFRFEYLGTGIPPLGAGSKARLGAVSRPADGGAA